MKLYSQNGFGEGRKVIEGLQAGYIDGAIISPKDISLEQVADRAQQYRAASPGATLLFDPQFYAALALGGEGCRLGNLLEDYSQYFGLRRRSSLEREDAVRDVLEAALSLQLTMPFLDAVIAPNIYISRSIDSAEALISKNFIRMAPEVYRKLGGRKPLLVTLAVSREALDKDEFLDFAGDITVLDGRPDGFYLLLGARNTDDRSEVYSSKPLSYWMYLNHILATVNGFTVVNGFADLLSPLYAAIGASACATGWWSNLRAFSLSRFEPAVTGGRLPTPRYVSAALLNRISFTELDQLRRSFPWVLNRLPTDDAYPEDAGSEPQRSNEVLQTWDALRLLCSRTVATDVTLALNQMRALVIEASTCYQQVEALGIRLEPKSGSDHLEAITDSLQRFRKLAEIDA